MEAVDKTTLFGEFDQSPAIQNNVRSRPRLMEIEESSVYNVEVENLDENLKLRIIQVATGSKGFFKHQQIGDPDISKQEKRRIVTDLLENKPAVFLERFGQFLSEDHLSYFEEEGETDYEIGFYLSEARQRQCKYVQEQRIKNRRFRAMQQMISCGDEHFSEDSMRQRNPLLYEQLIRRFQSEEEQSAAERPDMTNCSLSKIIIEHMDLDRERNLKKRLAGTEEEEEFDSDSEEDKEEEHLNLREEERNAQRKEFVQAAYQTFMAGGDPGIDYKQIDEDSNLDDLNLESRENEERYFDEDDADE